jgi:hypothetical protein
MQRNLSYYGNKEERKKEFVGKSSIEKLTINKYFKVPSMTTL